MIRSQFLESETKQSTECKTPVCSTDWCDQADDWGMEAENNNDCKLVDRVTAQPETDDTKVGLDVSNRLQGLCIDGMIETEPAQPLRTGPIFRPYYISVVEETELVGQKDLEHANRLLKEYEEREGVAVRETGW